MIGDVAGFMIPGTSASLVGGGVNKLAGTFAGKAGEAVSRKAGKILGEAAEGALTQGLASYAQGFITEGAHSAFEGKSFEEIIGDAHNKGWDYAKGGALTGGLSGAWKGFKGIGGADDTVIHRRVQGGVGTQSSQQRVVIDNDGNVYINKTDKNLNISIDNGEHSQYFSGNRPGADIYEFEVPKWFDGMVQENTIPQAGYKNNPLNQGGAAPKLTEPTTPGKSVEFPAPWVEWMEEYATNGRIILGGGQ